MGRATRPADRSCARDGESVHKEGIGQDATTKPRRREEDPSLILRLFESSCCVLRSCIYGLAQAKFAASFVSPAPLYFATCGNGHSGRVLSTLPAVKWDATIWEGFFPCSTHCSRTFTFSNVSVPGPPEQWFTPGIMNNSIEFDALSLPTLSTTFL